MATLKELSANLRTYYNKVEGEINANRRNEILLKRALGFLKTRVETFEVEVKDAYDKNVDDITFASKEIEYNGIMKDLANLRFENELNFLVDGLFQDIEKKKEVLEKKPFDAGKVQQLELAESDASILASVISENVTKAKENPEQMEKIIQEFKKAVSDIKKVIEEI